MTTNKFSKKTKEIKFKANSGFFFDSTISLVLLCVMFVIISSPLVFTNGTIEGLKLFVFSVLPGLFPFMLLTKLLTELGVIFKFSQKLDKFSYKVFGTPGVSMYAFLMSILSGYPIGAKIISDLYKKELISEKDAQKMSIFCTTSGPIFVIGTVGSIMLKSYLLGVIIYVSHILSSIVLGVLSNLFSYKTSNSLKTISTNYIVITKKQNILGVCISDTINSLFVVGAYITLFYLISELLTLLKIFSVLKVLICLCLQKIGISGTLVEGILYGIIEVTRGTKVLSDFGGTMPAVLSCGLISFSGISIIMQSLVFLKEAKIKTHTFIIAKCVHSILSMLLCYILLLII